MGTNYYRVPKGSEMIKREQKFKIFVIKTLKRLSLNKLLFESFIFHI